VQATLLGRHGPLNQCQVLKVVPGRNQSPLLLLESALCCGVAFVSDQDLILDVIENAQLRRLRAGYGLRIVK
jgi:hypothetical protein